MVNAIAARWKTLLANFEAIQTLATVTFALLILLGLVFGAAFIVVAQKIDYAEGDLLATGLLAAAAIYVIFAVLWGEEGWIRFEAVGIAIFSLIAFLARRFGILWIGAGWLLHIGWDYLFHIVGPGVHLAPAWYPPFCMGFDLVVGVYILWMAFGKQPPR